MRSGPCHLSVSGVMTDSLERYFIRRVRHAPAPQSMRPILATICLLRAASCLRSPESVPPMSCACSHADIISHARVCASTMCMDAITLEMHAPPCIPVAQLPFFMDAGITVDSEIIEQVSTEFFTQWWSLVASSSWLISGQLTR